ncbi:branched-chain amino acid ABC transporter permease [Desertimonas flava]|uniref:branched-chain amino acid ABC transporter permease n=1 Tax=Desertimonas flava TaxID=2064846 RepID=UPI000E3498E4|nr:branched-chain amino acid ABC transporter permease [Desertimonas flava]
MQTFLQQLANGLVNGSVYALIAIGVTLVYGLTNLINFAHGQLVTVGAFAAWSAVSSGIPFFLAVLIAASVGGGASLAMERGGFRFTAANPINGFILSLGLIFVIEGLMVERYGDSLHRIDVPIDGVLEVGGVQISYQRLVVVAVAAMLTVALMLVLRRTRVGRATRAYAEDPQTTALMGVNTKVLIMGVFLVGGALAGAAGALLLSLFGATVTLGAGFVVKAFVVSLIGGLGSVEGAALAALAVGLAETFGGAYISSRWTDFFGYVLVILIMLVRPSGLFKGSEGAHV